MYRPTLATLFLVLIVLELLLLESFLPYGWHHPIFELLTRIFPTQPYAPHPRMDLELEMALREHLSWRIVLDLFVGALAISNGLIISRLWKALRRSTP